jgi:hypothetical protein
MKSPRTKTSISRRALFGVIIIATAIAGWAVWRSTALPEDSPLAQMYRTEADLAALVTAVEQYNEIHGAYPPSGIAGLERAAEALSERVNFLPDGPPRDAWGRQYQYELEADGLYYVYSFGADGETGGDAAVDDISDDPRQTWRHIYRAAQRDYEPGTTDDAH